MYLSIYLSSWSINQSTNLSIYPSIYLSIYLSIHLSFSLSLSLSLSVCLSVYLSASLKTKQFRETSLIFERNNIQNKTILRDFFIFLHLTTSKTKKLCKTFSIFELDNIKNKTILRDFLQNGKLSAALTASYQCVLRFFLLHLSKVLRLPRKIDARSYEVLHLSRKIILANLQIWCSKMQPLSGNERPDLLTSLMNMSFVLRLPRKMHLCRSSSKAPCLPSILELLPNPHVLLTFDKTDNPLAPATRNDISTSKSGPDPWCF